MGWDRIGWDAISKQWLESDVGYLGVCGVGEIQIATLCLLALGFRSSSSWFEYEQRLLYIYALLVSSCLVLACEMMSAKVTSLFHL